MLKHNVGRKNLDKKMYTLYESTFVKGLSRTIYKQRGRARKRAGGDGHTSRTAVLGVTGGRGAKRLEGLVGLWRAWVSEVCSLYTDLFGFVTFMVYAHLVCVIYMHITKKRF